MKHPGEPRPTGMPDFGFPQTTARTWAKTSGARSPSSASSVVAGDGGADGSPSRGFDGTAALPCSGASGCVFPTEPATDSRRSLPEATNLETGTTPLDGALPFLYYAPLSQQESFMKGKTSALAPFVKSTTMARAEARRLPIGDLEKLVASLGKTLAAEQTKLEKKQSQERSAAASPFGTRWPGTPMVRPWANSESFSGVFRRRQFPRELRDFCLKLCPCGSVQSRPLPVFFPGIFVRSLQNRQLFSGYGTPTIELSLIAENRSEYRQAARHQGVVCHRMLPHSA